MVDFGGGASGALSGAAIGSAIPFIGTGMGALAGGVFGLFGGGKKKPRKNALFDKRQKSLYAARDQGIMGRGPLAEQYKFDANQANQVFDMNVGRPAYRNFEENIIPQITGQFRGQNLQNSSYTGEALARAGRNVQENLDAQRASLQFQGQQGAIDRREKAIQDALSMSTFAYSKGSANPVDQMLQAAAPSGASWFNDYLNSRAKRSTGTGVLAGARGFGG